MGDHPLLEVAAPMGQVPGERAPLPFDGSLFEQPMAQHGLAQGFTLKAGEVDLLGWAEEAAGQGLRRK